LILYPFENGIVRRGDNSVKEDEILEGNKETKNLHPNNARIFVQVASSTRWNFCSDGIALGKACVGARSENSSCCRL